MNSLFNILPEFVDRNMNISIMECEYNCDLALHNYITESSLLDSGIIVCESADDKDSIETAKDNKFIKVIKAIADAVRKITTAFVDMIKNMSGKKENISYNDFINSGTGQIQMSKDYAAINDKIEKEILDGRKIIKTISKGTHIDPKIVAEYCDKAGDVALKYGPATVSVGSILAIEKLTRRSVEKTCGEISDCEKELREDVENKVHDINRQEKKDKLEKKYADNPEKVAKKMARYDKKQALTKVFNAMAKRQNKLIANATAFINEVKLKANKQN